MNLQYKADLDSVFFNGGRKYLYVVDAGGAEYIQVFVEGGTDKVLQECVRVGEAE